MPKIRLLLAALVMALGAERASAQAYVVVVNAANPATEIRKDKMNALFLKRTTRWDDGTPATPVNLDRSSSTREAFSRAVHGKPVNAVEAYWQQQIFAGKEAPPVMRQSDSDVLAFVRANRGAVGYVSAGAALGGDVKAIMVH